MIFESAGMRLKPVRVVLQSESNEVLICEDLNEPKNTYYTAIVISDHLIVRRFLEIYEKSGISESRMECFSANGKYLIVYPYVRERVLSDFYISEVLSLEECEEICVNLIIACMTSDLPWPILYLVLTQGQVHLAADRTVYLSHMLDLTDLDESKTEKDCVVACAEILVDVLGDKAGDKADSYVLLKMKNERESYKNFPELYKDLELSSIAGRRVGIFGRIKGFFVDHGDQLFRVFLVICVLLLVFTIVTLITNAIFGDVPWLRIFVSTFEQIGRESMLQ